MSVTASAATARTFRVTWHHVQNPRSIINPRAQLTVLPRTPPKLEASFEVTARALDNARALARDYVHKRMGPKRQILSVNFTSRRDGLVVYTADKKEQL